MRSGAHECQIRSAPVLILPRLQRFSITLKRRQRAKIQFILALCQQSDAHLMQRCAFYSYDCLRRLSSSAFFSSKPGFPNKANMFTLYASTPGWSNGLTPSKYPDIAHAFSKKYTRYPNV
ncbi:hypothetical protein C883_3253 [Bacillus stratosphericus LAMA 585]|nr:hypothetical protein C883_3253 [Bacillus stratosphericus LAMA 585]